MPMPDQHFHFIRNSGEPPTHAQRVPSVRVRVEITGPVKYENV
jgi:hypothetical protein